MTPIDLLAYLAATSAGLFLIGCSLLLLWLIRLVVVGWAVKR